MGRRDRTKGVGTTDASCQNYSAQALHCWTLSLACSWRNTGGVSLLCQIRSIDSLKLHYIRSRTFVLPTVKMTGSLSATGTIWSMFSLIAAVLCCSGFYLPFWIQGRLLERADSYFNSFRRCNYPRLTSRGDIEIVMECGRYARFEDIPSMWWQVTTIVMCVGCALSVLSAVTALSACCFSYVLHSTSAKFTGGIQLLAALLMASGMAIYPLGWDNRQIRESCGNLSSPYRLGTCQLSWSVYILCSAVALLLLCALLSVCSAKNS